MYIVNTLSTAHSKPTSLSAFPGAPGVHIQRDGPEGKARSLTYSTLSHFVESDKLLAVPYTSILVFYGHGLGALQGGRVLTEDLVMFLHSIAPSPASRAEVSMHPACPS